VSRLPAVPSAAGSSRWRAAEQVAGLDKRSCASVRIVDVHEPLGRTRSHVLMDLDPNELCAAREPQ
jgi:hypothetical protein